MARPEILYPLFAPLEGLPGIGAKTAKLYEKLGVTRTVDLLFLIPHGVVDRRPRDSLAEIDHGEVATLRVTVLEHRPARAKGRPHRVLVEGAGAQFEVIYFHGRRDWLERAYPVGGQRVLSGRVELWEGRLQMPHPDYVMGAAEARELPAFEPVYPLTQGLGQRAVAKAVAAALERMPDLPEWIAPDLLASRHWPGWAEAVTRVHHPESAADLSPGAPARERLAYDEILSHQLALQLARARMRRGRGRASRGDGRLQARARAAFGHPPTGAQSRCLAEIAEDMGGETRMMRLLQGDVGAGKTWVAMMALLTAVEAGGQGALMAPTEILARQHAAGLSAMAEAAGVRILILTGRDKGAQRAEKLAAITDGTAGIVVGTHALLQEDVTFADLRLVVIDEQHRFGVRQRMELTDKAPRGADVLVMTATPIPRTLALANFGDLDISVLDEKPPGRQPVDTRLVSMERYEEVVARLAHAIGQGSRAYWVCPLVEESDTAPLVSAEERHRDLAKRLGPERVRLVHGQMAGADKDAAMADFQAGRAQVLVATTVIEVGVDVPEATIMVVEQAERFGLAQLHQLRGRVGRGSGASACLLLYRPPLGETARARLQTMRETEDGFRIAEEDLRLRGAGDMLGVAQSGLPRFRVADLERDQGLMERARDEARLVLHGEPELTGARGEALRVLLYLMDRDASVRLLKSG
jgi:ATP-dependent DNA helicase RecG